jgi:hypothetical protein
MSSDIFGGAVGSRGGVRHREGDSPTHSSSVPQRQGLTLRAVSRGEKGDDVDLVRSHSPSQARRSPHTGPSHSHSHTSPAAREGASRPGVVGSMGLSSTSTPAQRRAQSLAVRSTRETEGDVPDTFINVSVADLTAHTHAREKRGGKAAKYREVRPGWRAGGWVCRSEKCRGYLVPVMLVVVLVAVFFGKCDLM